MTTELRDALEQLIQRARGRCIVVLPETPDTAEIVTDNGRYKLPLSEARRRFPNATFIQVLYDDTPEGTAR